MKKKPDKGTIQEKDTNTGFHMVVRILERARAFNVVKLKNVRRTDVTVKAMSMKRELWNIVYSL